MNLTVRLHWMVAVLLIGFVARPVHAAKVLTPEQIEAIVSTTETKFDELVSKSVTKRQSVVGAQTAVIDRFYASRGVTFDKLIALVRKIEKVIGNFHRGAQASADKLAKSALKKLGKSPPDAAVARIEAARADAAQRMMEQTYFIQSLLHDVFAEYEFPVVLGMR